jgi:hypothetical protein
MLTSLNDAIDPQRLWPAIQPAGRRVLNKVSFNALSSAFKGRQ